MNTLLSAIFKFCTTKNLFKIDFLYFLAVSAATLRVSVISGTAIAAQVDLIVIEP